MLARGTLEDDEASDCTECSEKYNNTFTFFFISISLSLQNYIWTASLRRPTFLLSEDPSICQERRRKKSSYSVPSLYCPRNPCLLFDIPTESCK